MRYLSLFSGIGGFEIGIQQAFDSRQGEPQKTQRHGHTSSNGDNDMPRHLDVQTPQICIGYSDIDKYANKVYERNFNGHKAYGDITTINEKELPDFDCVVGGFPCQAFSVAGKRGGFDDTRGTLFFDIARILAEKKPKHLVLENVKGLLSSRTPLTFDYISDNLNTECVINIKQNQHTPIKEWLTLAENLSVYLRSIEKTSGLEENWRYLLDQSLQTTKRLKNSNLEQMLPSGLSVEEWATNLKRLSSIDNLQSLDMLWLEEMVVMSGEIVLSLKKNLEENSSQKKSSTISTELKMMTDLKTFMSVLIELNITSFMLKQSILSGTLWSKIKSNSKKENTYYAKTFNIIVSRLEELGYRVEWQVINSKDFGVPQNRERIIIVGHLREECRGQVFPIIGAASQDIRQIGNIHSGQRKRANPNTGRIYSKTGASPTLSTMQGGGLEPKIVAQRGRGNPPVQTYEPRKDHNTNTITSVQKDNFVATNQSKIRKLTPKECERLQGFPDDWTRFSNELDYVNMDTDTGLFSIVFKEISDTQRYKMCGNAVTTNVIEAVFSRMIEVGCV